MSRPTRWRTARSRVIGADLDGCEEGGALPLGIVVEVAGRKMQTTSSRSSSVSSTTSSNGAEGIQHNGQRDIAWTRVSKAAFDKGFRLEHFGKVLHARIHGVFGTIVDKVQVHSHHRSGRGRRR